jgi:hypothetical protein
MMLTVTPDIIYRFLTEDDDNPVDDATEATLAQCDITDICTGSEMSENRLGGDDICDIASQVRDACLNPNRDVVVWYGPDAECLVASYDKTKITVSA